MRQIAKKRYISQCTGKIHYSFKLCQNLNCNVLDGRQTVGALWFHCSGKPRSDEMSDEMGHCLASRGRQRLSPVVYFLPLFVFCFHLLVSLSHYQSVQYLHLAPCQTYYGVLVVCLPWVSTLKQPLVLLCVFSGCSQFVFHCLAVRCFFVF